ncbi:hypothetical protein C8J56DRAFT_1165586 [Mycena floridula]|nr:hypothetical protein C8J56DRAFT_1165586 [Mycena floridula]
MTRPTFTDIPTEIWNEIIALTPKRRQKRLRLTSAFFDDLVRPHLFKHLSLPKPDHHPMRKAARIRKTILISLARNITARISCHVRTLTVKPHLLPPEVVEQWLTRAISSFRELRNLQWMIASQPSTTIMNAIANLSAINSVDLIFLGISPDDITLPQMPSVMKVTLHTRPERQRQSISGPILNQLSSNRRSFEIEVQPAYFQSPGTCADFRNLSEELEILTLTVRTELCLDDTSYRHFRHLTKLKARELVSDDLWITLLHHEICIPNIEAPVAPNDAFWQYLESYSGLKKFGIPCPPSSQESLWNYAIVPHFGTLEALSFDLLDVNRIRSLSHFSQLRTLTFGIEVVDATLVTNLLLSTISELPLLVFVCVLPSRDPQDVFRVRHEIRNFRPIEPGMFHSDLEIRIGALYQLCVGYVPDENGMPELRFRGIAQWLQLHPLCDDNSIIEPERRSRSITKSAWSKILRRAKKLIRVFR